MDNSINIEFSKITVDEVRTGLGNSDIAIIRQRVRNSYPAARGGNSNTDALYAAKDFNGEGKSYISNRVTFLKVPKRSTKEDVQAKLDALPQARLYRIMSMDYKNVMTDEQIKSVEEGYGSKTFEQYEESLRAKHPETGDNLLFAEKPFYRAIYFSKTPVEDVDLRPSENTNFTVVPNESAISMSQPEEEVKFAEHF